MLGTRTPPATTEPGGGMGGYKELGVHNKGWRDWGWTIRRGDLGLRGTMGREYYQYKG